MRNVGLDDVVRTQHDQDRARAERLLDRLVTQPPKREARLEIIALFEQAREEGARFPACAFEVAYRRGLANPKIGELELEQLDYQRQQSLPTRSAQANKYYWGHVLEEMALSTGQRAEDIHDAMCERFLPNEHKRVEFFNRLTGETLTVDTDGRRSSKLTGTKFYDFVEEVRMFARDFLGVETQDPDPLYWRKRQRESVS